MQLRGGETSRECSVVVPRQLRRRGDKQRVVVPRQLRRRGDKQSGGPTAALWRQAESGGPTAAVEQRVGPRQLRRETSRVCSVVWWSQGSLGELGHERGDVF
ncbi:hypothetical protein NHX12_030991 [Muraenolepis orangiensis]|uniref:Uncharacterized protein n=1 Tax=Muraenolepis orangiensis TaxID=630683 RepID=A0A9Q0ILL8_9TELE|nr:hypothetical protein NHX12_030991 [Muraenolepis orangiensis]